MQDVTVLILTFNEQENIARTLSALRWAREVLVIDSFSTDGTLGAISQFPNARAVQRGFDNHTNQWNFGVAQATTEWVLALDADYVLSEDIVSELQQLSLVTGAVAYFARFTYFIAGRPLRGSLYPPRAVLFRKDRCVYVDDGHTQLLKIDGPGAMLNGVIFHDDRKSLSRWLDAQRKYAILEAEHLLGADPRILSRVDRLRRSTCLAPFLSLAYTLFWKRLILDGPAGWYYCLQRAYAELLLTLHLVDARLNILSEKKHEMSKMK